MKINIPRYILINFLMLFVADLLFLLNNDFWFIRSFIVTYLLSLLPGFLLLKTFNVRLTSVIKTLSYSLVLSLSLLIISSTALNAVFNYFKVAKLLEVNTLVITLNLFILILSILSVSLKKPPHAKDHFAIKNREYSFIDIFLLIVITLFPIISIVGTTILNNNGTNLIVLSNLVLIVLFVIVLLSKKFNESLYPYSLYSIGLTILLNISLRSWFINGTDILTEFKMFQNTLDNGYWSSTLIDHAYNICISITILPAIYASLTSFNDHYIFKLLFQLFFAVIPVLIYFFTKKFANTNKSYLSSILFISFPIYVNSMSMHIRQEVAFMFFIMLLIIMFDDELTKKFKNILIIMLGLSMIVSHYSTTFIALVLFTTWYFTDLLLKVCIKIWNKWKNKKNKVNKGRIPLYFLIMLYAFSFVWYSQLASLSNNLINLKNKVISNLSDVHNSDVRIDQTSLSNQFNLFYKQPDRSLLLNKYVNQERNIQESDSLFYPYQSYKDYKPKLLDSSPQKLNIPFQIFKYINIYQEFIKKLFKVLSILGVIYLVKLFITRKHVNYDYLILSIVSLTILLLFTVLPFFTIEYDILRATQQLLIILGYSTILGIYFILEPFNSRLKSFVSIIFVLSYFLIYTNTINQIIGGTVPSIQFANSGTGYERFIIYSSEQEGIQWLLNNKKKEYLIQSDQDSLSKIYATSLSKTRVSPNLIPVSIYKNSYIFLNKLNATTGLSYKNYQGETLRYTLPIIFFDDNKDLIYNNGGAKVYK